MESIKEIISWYATKKANIVLDSDYQRAIDIISDHFAESLGGGNYSDEEIFNMIKKDDLMKEYYDKSKEHQYIYLDRLSIVFTSDDIVQEDK